MSIGTRIRYSRKENGFTQGALAELIGVSVQAISKWECDAGMPDISQIIPLSRALGVTSDYLLGISQGDSDTELCSLRKQIGHHGVSFGQAEAERIYTLAEPYFAAHPTAAECAFWCLESYVEYWATAASPLTAEPVSACERYYHAVVRYETDTDRLCLAHFIMARAYRLSENLDLAEQIMNHIPETFGDRTYWEAEFAYADHDYETALRKCKASFAEKARFLSRCIRLARMISVQTDGEAGLNRQIALNEYMLALINAVLTGGDFLPYRQIYQKTSLLLGMTGQYVRAGDKKRARICYEELLRTRDAFFDALDHPEGRDQLLFDTSDTDAHWYATREQIDGYVRHAKELLDA